MYYVYILHSKSSDRFYKGQTSDIEKRLVRHNSGKVPATSRAVPWDLIWCTSKESRSEAIILEKKLKNLNRDRLIQFILKYSDGFSSQEAARFIIDHKSNQGSES